MPDVAFSAAPTSSALPAALSTLTAPSAKLSAAAADPFAALLGTLATPAPSDPAAPAQPSPLAALLAKLPIAPATPIGSTAAPPAIAQDERDPGDPTAPDSDEPTDKDAAVAPAPDPAAISPAIAALMALPKPAPAPAPPAAGAITSDRPQPTARLAPKSPAPAQPSAAGTKASPEQVATPQEQAAWQAILANPGPPPAAATTKAGDRAADKAASDEAPEAPAMPPADAAPIDTTPAKAAPNGNTAPATHTPLRHDTAATDVRAGKRSDKDKDSAVDAPKSTAHAAHIADAAAPLARSDAQTTATAANDLTAASALDDAAITRTLNVAQDGQWLDSLTRDIAATASGTTLQFRLDPAHLGALAVRIEHAADGASVHMTSNNADTRQMLVDAQPRLAAEARAQGLTLKDSSVGSGLSDQRPSSPGGTASGWTMGGQSTGQGSDRRPAPMPQSIRPAQDIAPAPVIQTDDTARYA